MYKKQFHTQLSFDNFNQPIGLSMNPENRWIKKAELIPWTALEGAYASLFESNKGNVAKPFRTAFGALLIQQEYGYSDEEAVLQIQENPYLQFFIGLPGYQDEKPFDSSTMVYFRKRLTAEKLMAINETILAGHEGETEASDSTDDDDSDGNGSSNKGTLMLDATCAPSYIKYPQDIGLLNDARLPAEKIIDELCQDYGLPKPRTYRKVARKEYLSIAKRKKKTKQVIRKAIRKQLGYVARDVRYIKEMQATGISLSKKQALDFDIIQQILGQQEYMYDNRVHRVPNRIVSFHQPFLRPIVRGKAKTPTEFGAKVDVSQANGFLRIERLSFDAFNESEDLIPSIERYCERTGHHPERVLADQIYRTRENRRFCQEHQIRLSGPKLGRPKKDGTVDKKVEYGDNRDRIQIERDFSLAKRCHGLGMIRTRLESTTYSTIALSIVSLNLSKIQRDFLRAFFESEFSGRFSHFFIPKHANFRKLAIVQ